MTPHFTRFYFPVLILMSGFFFSCQTSPIVQRTTQKVLVIGAENEWLTSLTTDHSIVPNLEDITEDSLLQFSTIIFHQTNWDSLSPYAQSLTQRYTQAGNGVILLECDSLSHPLQWEWMTALAQRSDSLSNSGNVATLFDYDGGTVSVLSKKIDAPKFTNLIQSSIGDNSYNRSLVTSPEGPDDRRFNIRLLSPEIHEPMEMVILPNLDVLFLERRGKIKLYQSASGNTSVVNEFDVCTEGNYEDGLHGLALDPAFGRDNNWIYLFYSPPCENPNQILARFEFRDGKLDRSTEVHMLDVKVQRETCCHSGGSLAFDAHGNLFLSTGDNSISTESDGFSPMDERPGKYYNDSQKSSGNTNDLRGKILRIRPQPDGSYTIPEGNLFPTAEGIEGRPEIYVMGCRNPFRIGIDKKRDFLLWGDVGPDGKQAGPEGPNAHDEFNIATSAGHFGWPHITANNLAYADRDFATGKINGYFDPKAVLNDSPNNDGSKILPPAKEALIYYTYGASEEFPMLGSGGRSAMGGPVYYNDKNYVGSKIELPEYYNGKAFIYDWVRNWIKVITLDDSGKLKSIAPFLPKEKFYGIIDMEVGPEGALYIMEYGNGYFLKNPEARLVRIEYYKGNQVPVAKMKTINAEGVAPLAVEFSAAKSYDPDQQDSLTYHWYFNDDNIVDARGKDASWTFSKKGTHTPKVEVIDPAGAKATALGKVIVGNAPPMVDLIWQGNKSFAFPNQLVDYQIAIKDPEDEDKGGIQMEAATVQANYAASDDYVYQVLRGEKELPMGSLIGLDGKKLINENDCRSCHLDKKKSNGPSYFAVAQRYDDTPITKETLISKIIRGGVGNWGKKSMSAHPELAEADASKMVDYILSMDKSNNIPTTGKLSFENEVSNGGGYFLTASYRDQGFENISPLRSRKVKVLRSPRLPAAKADQEEGMWPATFGKARDKTGYIVTRPGYIKYNQLDLSGVRQMELMFEAHLSCIMECRLDAPDGKLIGSLALPNGNAEKVWATKKANLQATNGLHDVYFVFKKPNKQDGQNNFANIQWIQFHN